MFIFIIKGLIVELEIWLISIEVVKVTFGVTNFVVELVVLINFVIEVVFNIILGFSMFINLEILNDVGTTEVIFGIENLVVTLDVLINFRVVGEMLNFVLGIVTL